MARITVEDCLDHVDNRFEPIYIYILQKEIGILWTKSEDVLTK